jgi:hypothetical protein
MPKAGLPPALVGKDKQVECAALHKVNAFEPYGSDLSWPQPGNPPPHAPIVYQCPPPTPTPADVVNPECARAPLDFVGVLFSSAGTCEPTEVCSLCTNSSLIHACAGVSFAGVWFDSS